MAPAIEDLAAEWLEPDGLGAFASGTIGAGRTRRYHGLLMAAVTPPTGRQLLVSGVDAWLEPGGDHLTLQRYAPDVTSRTADHLVSFTVEPWPTWRCRLGSGIEIEHELFVPRDHALVVLRWRMLRPIPGARLMVRPFLVGRDIHALRSADPAARLEPVESGGAIRWSPWEGVPAVLAAHTGQYRHEPTWYRRFQLDEERARGFDFLEDAAAPGVLELPLDRGPAVLVLAAEGQPGAELLAAEPAGALAERLRKRERLRRNRFPSRLARAADGYLVRRGEGKTIVAGYPWFTDWGRDTFISLRGLLLATGRLEDARQTLLAWADTVSEGMLPNRFVDQGDAPEFNSVDASLWYVVVVRELIAAFERAGKRLLARDRRRLEAAVIAILEGYARGTRYGIRADDDGLLAAGVPGVQLTWMDAKVGDWVVTPRIGKPVEIQALWINALAAGGDDPRWRLLADRARESFARRFWNPDRACLYDVVDADGVAGRNDGTLRPNQIFAVGGLPEALLSGDRARSVVEVAERELLTPLGLRSLARSEAGYRARYLGGPVERDGAYHQGTVWPWLLGAFVEGWLRVRGGSPGNRAEARERFLAPLVAHLDAAGLGHVSEIADAEPPFTPRGCPFQAWSVGEALRIEALVSDAPAESPGRRGRAVAAR